MFTITLHAGGKVAIHPAGLALYYYCWSFMCLWASRLPKPPFGLQIGDTVDKSIAWTDGWPNWHLMLLTRISRRWWLILNTNACEDATTRDKTTTVNTSLSSGDGVKEWELLTPRLSTRLQEAEPVWAQILLVPSYSLLPGWSQMELCKGHTSCRYDRL